VIASGWRISAGDDTRRDWRRIAKEIRKSGWHELATSNTQAICFSVQPTVEDFKFIVDRNTKRLKNTTLSEFYLSSVKLFW
jgi:hypothetical protein